MPDNIANLMRANNCNAAVHYRWQAQSDADGVFEKLREKAAWTPPRALIVRLDGDKVAPYQAHWVSVCWSNEALRDKPFQHWWQYMSAVGFPEAQGWKASWELAPNEQADYSNLTKVRDFFVV